LILFGVEFLSGPSLASDLLPLDKDWRLQSSEKAREGGQILSTAGFEPLDWYSTEVPSTVLAALVENGVYPDPYYSDNLTKIPGYKEGRWLAMPEDSPFRHPWWYRTEFEIPMEFAGKNLALCFDGINYRADIWLNGNKIAGRDEAIGMFRRFEFDATIHSKVGDKNALAVEIIAPGQISDKNYRTKQLEATTGWDDHNPQPPDLNMGIWEDVYLLACGSVRLRHPYVSSDLEAPSLEAADLRVQVELENLTDREVKSDLRGRISDLEFAQTLTLAPREKRWVEFTSKDFPQLHIENPRVWWPHPLGPQELYELDLNASADGEISDSVSTRFGIRDATTYINDEGWRGYRINGKNVLIRGGAWMTCDMLLRFTDRRYRALVRYAREANLNMLRSEGFSIRETDEFYDLCDEYGVMVTQQIFGRSIPDEKLAIGCIEDTLLRIRNHPSLVHFLGHDETFPTPTLDRAYRDLIEKYRLNRTYQPHSGAFDVEERFETGGTRTGTRELWTYANPTKYYIGKEDGAWGFAQSGGIGGIVAPLESLRRMLPEEALWPPTHPIWSLHTVVQGVDYFDTVFEQLDLRYGKATGIRDFEKKAMALNYECARAMFEAWGRNKYDATGITTWKYDAAWPAAMTWQYVDWYLNVGGAYYGAKKACEPLHIQYSYDDDSIYVVNSLYEAFENLEASVRIFNLDLVEKYSQNVNLDVEPDEKTEVLDIEWPEGLGKTFFLDLRLKDGDGETVSRNFYWLSPTKDVVKEVNEGWLDFSIAMETTPDFTLLNDLPPVALEVESEFEAKGDERVATVRVANPSDRLAFGVRLAVTKGEGGQEVLPSYWEDNYISLLPGERRVLTANFSPEDLGESKPSIQITGWNVAN
jgi:exo-1,4-beta-D-glucosaminidase